MRIKITNCTVFSAKGDFRRRSNQNIEIGVPDDLWGYNSEELFLKALLKGHNLTYRGQPFEVTISSKITCYQVEKPKKSIQQTRIDKLNSLGILLDNEKIYE